MKKISVNSATLYEAIKTNSVQPNTNVKMNIDVTDDVIAISIEENFGEIQEAYLVAYDKKVGAVLAYQEIIGNNNNEFLIVPTDDFVDDINKIDGFKYARLCMAIKSNDMYYFFYLTSVDEQEFDDSNCFISSFCECKKNKEDIHLILYYSQAGLLSVKPILATEYYEKFCRCTIDSLKHEDNKLLMKLSCIASSKLTGYPVLISKSTKKASKYLSVNVLSRTSISNIREMIECEIDFGDLSLDLCDGYTIVYQLGKDILELVIDEDYDIASNESFEEIYNINVSENTFNVAYYINENRRLSINIAEHIYPYMFSIIMAVYNTEQFLEEALDSILKQNTRAINKYVIGNEAKDYNKQIYRNIYEVIMVDDGATDSSGTICDRYVEENKHFKVIHKENGGVSTARNAGIEIASGKYFNFMDSDDKFSDNVLKECFEFFEANYEKTDMITFPIKFFDASKGDHWLNGKFDNGQRIINMFDEYDKAIMFVNASVFKAEKIKGKIRFVDSLTTGEDIRFIYSMFFKEGARFGVLNKCTYWYRRRSAGEPSAIQASKTTTNYYFEYMSQCMDWLLEESRMVYGMIPQFVQYLVAQQLQWRFKEDGDATIAKTIITESEFEEYKEHIRCQLQWISADIILEQSKIFREQKKYILELKSGKELDKFYDGTDVSYFFESKKIATASSNYIRVEFIKFRKDELYLEGYSMSFEKDSKLYIKIDEEFIELQKEERDMNIYSLGDPIFHASAFKYSIKLDDTVDSYSIGFYEKIGENYVLKKDVRYAKTTPISNTYSKSYYVEDNWGLRKEGNLYVVSNLLNVNNALKYFKKYEDEFVSQIASKVKKQIEKDALQLRKEIIPFVANYKRYKKKQIWLISDRVNMAGDNGEAFFLYMLEQNSPDIELYFVINEDSPDYERMSKIGNVLVQNSKKHIMMHFVADYIISSQANEYVINPFFHDGTTDIFRDLLYKPKFVFLQHGVIKDDLSDWLNRYKKDMTGFVTAAIPEYESIFDYNYYYTENEVWLTGLPRHDRLYSDEKKYVTIMPTWRKYLSTSSPDDPEVTMVKEGFEESDFFKFYNRLINNSNLLEAAERTGYTICFMPHPNIMNNLEAFDHNSQVKFFGTEKPYREIYAESSLVMTDYSSSVMDFAYLRKPIVYCQFDSEEFFAGNHVYVQGYFEYERDGFGEVTYDLETLVDKLIEYMDNNCKLKDVYKERMDKFFAYNDDKNCERLYNKLLDLKKLQ